MNNENNAVNAGSINPAVSIEQPPLPVPGSMLPPDMPPIDNLPSQVRVPSGYCVDQSGQLAIAPPWFDPRTHGVNCPIDRSGGNSGIIEERMSLDGDVPFDENYVEECIRRADGTLIECHNRIESDIDNRLQPCEACCNKTNIIIIGDIDERFEQPERCLAKCGTRIDEDVMERLGACYIRNGGIGLPFPSDMAVAIGEQTNEELRSCFLEFNEDGTPYSGCWPEDLLGPNPYPCERRETPPPYCEPPPPPPPPCGVEPGTGIPMIRQPNQDGTPGEGTCEPFSCPPGYHPQEHPIGSGQFVCVIDSFSPPPPPPPFNMCSLGSADAIRDNLVAEFVRDYGRQPEAFESYSITQQANDLWAECEHIAEGRVECPFTLQAIPLPKWCSPDIVSQIDNWTNNVDVNVNTFKQLIGLCRGADGQYGKNLWTKWLYEAKLVPDWVPDSLNGIVEGAIEVIWEVTEITSQVASGGSRSGLVFQVLLALGRFLNKKYGVPSNDWLTQMEYSANVFAPTRIPSTPEANAAFLANTIDNRRWETYVAANNDCVEPQERMVEAARSRPSTFELTQLLMRGDIDQAQFRAGVRENGVLTDIDRERFVKLAVQLPGISDIVRFLVRDVSDTKVIDSYNLYDEFEDKWKGRLPKYATSQGVTKELMQDYWAAHWEWPSNTQLYQMVHRNRPGRVDKGIVVTKEDMLKVLGINDIAPYWRERLASVSYNVITRTDAQRAFFIGSIDVAELKEIYMDEGYNERDADILVKFTVDLKKRRNVAETGEDTAKQIAAKFVKGIISSQQLIVRLIKLGRTQEQAQEIEMRMIRKREDIVRKAVIDATEKAFLNSEIDIAVARIKLMDELLDAATIQYLLDVWVAKAGGKSKLMTGAQLCKAKERSLITSEEYAKKLIAAGYTKEDTNRIIRMCDQDNDDRATKEMNRIIAKEAAKKEKERKEIERRAEKQKQEMEKQRKEAEKKEKERKKEEEKKKKEEKEKQGEEGGK